MFSLKKLYPVVCACLLLGGCQARAQRNVEAPVTTPEPTEVAPDTARPLAPMTVKLSAREIQPAGELVELTATLTVTGRLPASPVVRILLPDGATLVTGQESETLNLDGQEGQTLERVFRVAGLGRGAVKVIALAAGERAGASAEATWPEPKPSSGPAPVEMRKIPRTKVGGETVDRAVPIN